MIASLKAGIANVLIVVLCLGMVGAGMIKLMSLESVVEVWNSWGLPTWLRYVIGSIEFVIGLCIFIPATRKYAIVGLFLIMIGALSTHLYFGEYWDTRGPLLVMIGGGLVWYLQGMKL